MAVPQPEPSSLKNLIYDSISKISSSVLRNSFNKRKFPKEAVFQHMLMSGLAQCTPSTVSICPELGEVFSEVNDKCIAGEIDFYINSSLLNSWGIELVVNGNEIGEHMDRFGENGVYFPLNVKDYVVLDFRCSKNGMKTSVKRYKERASVFFLEGGDYSSCQIQYGYGLVEKIMLSQ